MGNHDAGRAMGHAAEAAKLASDTWPPSKEKALALLDKICNPWRGCDAEFEAKDPDNPRNVHPVESDYKYPPHALGELLAVAFGEGRTFDHDDDDDPYYDVVIAPFSRRYQLY